MSNVTETMRSYTPGNEDDEKTIQDLRAEPWMLRLLKLNPSYVYWGPHEDYMYKPGDGESWHEQRRQIGMPEMRHGWEARILFKTWAEHTVVLDDLNEVVNFYFSIERDATQCVDCQGTGYHPDAMWISETFYPHMAEALPGRDSAAFAAMVAKYPDFKKAYKVGWHTSITQDEVEALVAERRLVDFTHVFDKGWKPKDPPCMPTADEVNQWASGRGLGHDAINRMILVETRLKRLGIPKTCPTCKGSGHVYTSDRARLVLTYWLLHPRKGASRGVEVADIKQTDMAEVLTFLRTAAERNAERFAKVVAFDEDRG